MARSRGLGDVYKRQDLQYGHFSQSWIQRTFKSDVLPHGMKCCSALWAMTHEPQ
jgi:hypothetical protein